MLRSLLPAWALSVSLAAPALAQTPPTLTESLAQAETPFKQGALQALIAIERLMQSNYDYGIGQGLRPGTMFILAPPANGTPNPAPKPRKADSFANMIKAFAADLDTARSTLAQVPSENAVAFTFDLSALWFDVNSNGQFDAGESALPWVASLAPRAGAAPDLPDGPVDVRFDGADHAWLMAYTHVLSASAEAILAFDPTPVFADLLAAEARLADLPEVPYSFDVDAIKARIAGLEAELDAAVAGRDKQDLRRQIRAARAKLPPEDRDAQSARAQAASLNLAQFRDPLNAVYALLTTLRQAPDPVHVARFETHMRAMLQHNRRFWDLVALETDNDREWVPNGAQTSALGFEIPDQMATDWQLILADMEAVLDGRLLIPHPLVPPETGINLAAWFDAPSPLDPVAWIHGRGAYPYLARGPRISAESWNAFQRSTGGNGFGFALFLN